MTGEKFDGDGLFDFTQRLSWDKKKAYNFKWAEKNADYYDYFHSTSRAKKENLNLLMNYDLYNGRSRAEYFSADPMFFWNLGEDDEIAIEDKQIKHHDIISKIAKAMVGEQRKRPLTPMAVDTSRYTLTARKKKKLELLQNYINETIIQPIQQQAAQKVFQQYGIEDPYSLQPEEQQQIQGEIDQAAKAMTPKEAYEYMRSEFKAPEEIQAQKIVDYLMKELKIKELTDEGFKHAVITGKEVYRVGVRNSRPFVDIVNPVGFTWSGSPDKFYIEDGEWAKHEQYIKFTDVFNKYANHLSKSDVKKLESLFIRGEGNNSESAYRTEIESKLVSVVSTNPEEYAKSSSLDIRTQEGQRYAKDLYSRISNVVDPRSSVREVHVVWKALRKLKYIKRIDYATGKVDEFFIDESYEFNPGKGDFEQSEVWVPEVWETTKLGFSTDSVYVLKRPVPYQYKSLNNPFDVKLPYVGIEYNRLMGNSQNVSPIDLGKPWQYKFNVQMARLQELEATDLGKVLLTTMQAKPKNWTWKQFYQTIRYGKLGVLDLTQEGINPVDAQVFKGVDLGNAQDIAAKLQYLEFLKTQVAEAMSYNPSRLGEISPYTAVRNNQQNIMQSAHQTEDFFTMHNIVVENMLNELVKCARIAYKENPVAATMVLDDMSRAEIEIDEELLDRAEIGVFIRNSGEDFQNMDIIKQQMQSMVQNGTLSFSELARVLWAKTGAEVLNIAEQAEERAQQMAEQQSQKEMEMMQANMELQKQLAEFQSQLDTMSAIAIKQPELEMQLRTALVEAMKYANQQDIDGNKEHDMIQLEEKKQELEAKENAKERKHEAVENEKERQLKRELERIKARNKSTPK